MEFKDKSYNRELLLLNFKINNVPNSKCPTIKISFEVKNIGTDNAYTIFYPSCKIMIFNDITIDTLLYPRRSSWYTKSEHEPETGELGLTGSANLVPGTSLKFEKIICLAPHVLSSINEKLEQYPVTERKIDLYAEIILPTVQFGKDSQGLDILEYKGGILHKFEIRDEIEGNEWLRWLRSWRYNIGLISVPDHVAQEINKLMRSMGFLKEWEVISALLRDVNKDYKLSLLRGNAEQPTLKNKVHELLDNSKKRIYAAVQSIDTEILNDVLEALKRGVDVRIVIWEPDKGWFGRKRNSKVMALKKLKDKIEIRVNTDIHCRMLLADGEVLIGSMDLDKQGLSVHDNLAIYTNDSTIVKRTEEEFYKIYDDSQDLQGWLNSKNLKLQ